MIKNILTYLGILLAAFVFSIFYYRWFSWVLLIIIAAVPFLSLLFSLPFMISAASNGVMIFCDESLKAGEDLKIGFAGKKGRAVFCPSLKLKLKAQNNFADVRKTINVFHGGSMKKAFYYTDGALSKHCGMVEIHVKSCRFYDFTGLFFIPIRAGESRQITVMPAPEKPKLMPDSEKVAVVGFKPKSGGGFSDYYELRAFQNGDSLRNVHWKISSKYDELIVREPSLPVYRRLAVRLELSVDSAKNDGILARFLYVCDYFIQNGSPCLCQGAGGFCVLENRDDIGKYIASIYSGRPCQTDVIGGESPIIYRISESGEEVGEW